jgi:hypothetical protein
MAHRSQVLVSVPAKESTGMPLDVKIEPKENYLLVKANGTFDNSSARACLPEIFALCSQHGLSNVLMDFTEVRGSSMMVDRYAWADSISKLHSLYIKAGGQPLRLAFIGTNDSVSESYPIREKVAVLYSLDLKETTDINEAHEWLGI